ncbi:arylamine N-acetyltransferase [Streptomyces sp. NPDC127114]|uniref:arylamine N-acetyltransferase n=1 Tax=Streptomyces sp. NPDC127114 TaxID=3345366 RepID=UPI00362BA809
MTRGRGGYRFHLDGAFAALLTALGYEVTLNRAGVQDEVEDPAGRLWDRVRAAHEEWEAAGRQ